MSALSVQPTFPIFTDVDGQPLEDGYIWIGTVNLPAQTNPISVYWIAPSSSRRCCTCAFTATFRNSTR